MLQIADRRGILQPDFEALIAECKAAVAERKRDIRRALMAQTRDRLQSLGQSVRL